jgi:iron complex outermembrane receptor protein
MRSCTVSLLFFVLSITPQFLFAQRDTVKPRHLEEVIITAYKEEPPEKTSLVITALNVDSLSRGGNYNLTDMIAKTPGVTMLSTGPAISKPVIRGLYGNRTLVLLSGLKFDNQQWQEEHGLGLQTIGLSKVELIKGPMSVLYGTEAMGGIINLVEEQKPAAGKSESDISMKFHTNTMGGLLHAGVKQNNGKNWFRLRLGAENNGDYFDGNHKRVLNSRFDGYYLKAGYGFIRGRWISNNNYSSSFNRFGFIFKDVFDFLKPDERWSRALAANPAHFVILNILSSENRIDFGLERKLSINAGIQSNERMENEGSGAISLNMHLLTLQYLLKYETPLNAKNRMIISHLGSFENNTNFGARKIVPDANMQEANLSLYLETEAGKDLVFENGIGAGEKFIQTFYTPLVNGPDKSIRPFQKFAPFYNLYSGFSLFAKNRINFKFNAATGVRIPNLAELSSDGLHEGVFTYEIGSPLLKNEQNLSLNFYGNVKGDWIELNISPFWNYFFNYVYLAPTPEQWLGFPVYRYRQQDCRQYGTEASLFVNPWKQLSLKCSYSGMISQTQDGSYTPYTPAQKISSSVTWRLPASFPVSLIAGSDYCLMQARLFPGEIGAPEYLLFNAGIQTSLTRKSVTFELSLMATNLTDRPYYDNLSRFKYYGINNQGRNLSVSLRVKFAR